MLIDAAQPIEDAQPTEGKIRAKIIASNGCNCNKVFKSCFQRAMICVFNHILTNRARTILNKLARVLHTLIMCFLLLFFISIQFKNIELFFMKPFAIYTVHSF